MLNMRNINHTPVILSFIAIMATVGGCHHTKSIKDATDACDSIAQTIPSAPPKNDSTIRDVFGVPVKSEPADYAGVLDELDAAGVLHVETIHTDSTSRFIGAVIEFASIKFGLNKGYIFITSRHSPKDYRKLKRAVEKHYGKGEYDDETRQYLWNTQTDSAMSIRIRQLHGNDDGIVMFWSFPRPHSVNDTITH